MEAELGAATWADEHAFPEVRRQREESLKQFAPIAFVLYGDNYRAPEYKQVLYEGFPATQEGFRDWLSWVDRAIEDVGAHSVIYVIDDAKRMSFYIYTKHSAKEVHFPYRLDEKGGMELVMDAASGGSTSYTFTRKLR